MAVSILAAPCVLVLTAVAVAGCAHPPPCQEDPFFLLKNSATDCAQVRLENATPPPSEAHPGEEAALP